MTPWAQYVIRMSGTDVSTDIAAATGIAQSSIYRWLHKAATPSTAHAAKFAQTYGRPVLEAFVAAEFLTEEEAGVKVVGVADIRGYSSGDLIREIERRILNIERYDSARQLGTSENLLQDIRIDFANLMPSFADPARYAIGDLAATLSLRFAQRPELQQRALAVVRSVAMGLEALGAGDSDEATDDVIRWCEHYMRLATSPQFDGDEYIEEFEATTILTSDEANQRLNR